MELHELTGEIEARIRRISQTEKLSIAEIAEQKFGLTFSALYKYMGGVRVKPRKILINTTGLRRLGPYFAQTGDIEMLNYLASYALGVEVEVRVK